MRTEALPLVVPAIAWVLMYRQSVRRIWATRRRAARVQLAQFMLTNQKVTRTAFAGVVIAGFAPALVKATIAAREAEIQAEYINRILREN